jgi:ADP-ribose pyrophosphatase YjhB (NUDIX family)
MEPGMLPAPPEPIRNNPLAQALTHGSLDRALPLLFPYLSETVIAWFMPEERLWPVSIKGVVFVDAKVILLLNDRAEWELSGGRLELGETPEACLRRELNEELGCEAVVSNLLLADVLEVIPGKFVFIVAYHCFLSIRATELRSATNTKSISYFLSPNLAKSASRNFT